MIDAPAPKRIGRPPVPPELRAEPTHPRSVRLTDAEWSELQRRGVRGGPGAARMIAGKMRTEAEALRFAKVALSGEQKRAFLAEVTAAFGG